MSVDTELARARSLAKRGAVAEARQIYQSVLDRFPANRRAQEGIRELNAVAARLGAPSRHGGDGPSGGELEALAGLYRSGRFEEVISRCGALGARLAGSAEVNNLLGAAHAMLGQLTEALACYDRAIGLSRDYAEAHHNRGNVLKALGRQDEAIAAYGKAIAARPAYGEAHRNLSTLRTFAKDDPEIAAMRRLLSAGGLSDRDRMHLGFALAKALEDAGETAGAFAALSEANRLRKADLSYHIASDERLFARIESVFSRPAVLRMAPIRDPATLARRPIFILGMPRSGTTLVEQILASHSAVHGGGEMGALNALAAPALAEFERISSGSGTGSGAPEEQLKRLLQKVRSGYDGALQRCPPGRPVVTDKMPSNFRWIGLIRLALPEAVIVHVKRDPVATCWSIAKTYFATGGNGYAYDLADVASYYKLYARLMRFWHEHFPGVIYDLDYEALTLAQEQETRRLLAHCGLEWEPQCLAFHKSGRAVETASAAQVRREMYRGSSEAWRKFEAELQPLIAALRE